MVNPSPITHNWDAFTSLQHSNEKLVLKWYSLSSRFWSNAHENTMRRRKKKDAYDRQHFQCIYGVYQLHFYSTRKKQRRQKKFVQSMMTLDSLEMQHKEVVDEIASPDIWTQLATCWGHPFPRIVDTFTNFPTRHILHYFCLVFKILLPLWDKSK